MHMLSPLSKGLYKKVIAESGSSLNPWAVYIEPYDPTDAAYLLADNSGCPRLPHEDLLACLRTMDPFLISAMTPIQLYNIFTWAPVVDGPGGFLPDEPLNLLKNGQFNMDVPVLIGYNKDETSPLMVLVDGAGDGMTRDEFNQLLWDRNVLGRKYYSDTNIHYEDLFKAYGNQYTPWEDPENVTLLRDAYMELLDENIFHAGIHWQARAFSIYGLDTYVYRFDYDRSGILPDWMGVPHVAELFYVFGSSYQDNAFAFMEWTDEDRKVSDTVQTLWCNFAKSGNPTPDGMAIPNRITVSTKYFEPAKVTSDGRERSVA
uniref:Acetylcholinesterase-like n=1 Tax=Saccoglossus kowalevskii TaxID=10224 RepID=A0ABM0M019_SACKO|nr:PREDICTED: acetylcholinesterase-like [Saccoglossus kowalevskii]